MSYSLILQSSVTHLICCSVFSCYSLALRRGAGGRAEGDGWVRGGVGGVGACSNHTNVNVLRILCRNFCSFSGLFKAYKLAGSVA